MKSRPLFKNPLLWLASTGIATVIVVACSSTTTPSGGTTATCTGSDTIACECANGQTGTTTCNDPSACSCNNTGDDSGTVPVTDEDSGHNGDGGHIDDGASPAELYSACARTGSFGSPCTVPNAIDTTDCTDPDFPYCFGGGQGYWCTAACDVAVDAGDAGEDGGDEAGGFAPCLIEVPDGGFPDGGVPNLGCTPTACNAKGYCK